MTDEEGKRRVIQRSAIQRPFVSRKKRWKIRKGTEYILKSSLVLREMINLASSSYRVRSCGKVLRDWLLFRKQKKAKNKNQLLGTIHRKISFFYFHFWGKLRGRKPNENKYPREESQAGTFVPHLTSHPLLSLPTFFLFFFLHVVRTYTGKRTGKKKKE